MKKILIVALVLILSLGASKLFADNIGYVDMQEIFVAYEDAQKAQKEFKEKQEEYQKEVEKKQKEIEKKQKKIEKARSKDNSEKEVDKLTEELEDLVKQSEQELEPKKQEILLLNQQLTSRLKNKIIVAAEAVAKEYGIDVVVDKQVILIGGFDLTKYVIAKLNK